jgi:hypothetical protein
MIGDGKCGRKVINRHLENQHEQKTSKTMPKIVDYLSKGSAMVPVFHQDSTAKLLTINMMQVVCLQFGCNRTTIPSTQK